VLRLGHRPARDARVTTHVALAARAFGADGMYLAARDPGVVQKEEGGCVIHLTMYGQPFTELMEDLRLRPRILIVVGAEKVPGELYGLADYNVSVTAQPHSEISGLAVFLDHLFQGSELDTSYPDAAMHITPYSPLRGE
jgi:tRNA (cytidine56-2'-O)-methyltransferase